MHEIPWNAKPTFSSASVISAGTLLRQNRQFLPAVARKSFYHPRKIRGIQFIASGVPTRTLENSAPLFSRLGCADDAIANFPPTLDAGVIGVAEERIVRFEPLDGQSARVLYTNSSFTQRTLRPSPKSSPPRLPPTITDCSPAAPVVDYDGGRRDDDELFKTTGERAAAEAGMGQELNRDSERAVKKAVKEASAAAYSDEAAVNGDLAELRDLLSNRIGLHTVDSHVLKKSLAHRCC